jgi:hypothetical protein
MLLTNSLNSHQTLFKSECVHFLMFHVIVSRGGGGLLKEEYKITESVPFKNCYSLRKLIYM